MASCSKSGIICLKSTFNKIRTNWEKELQITFSDDFWKEALRAVNSSTSRARLSLIQFKVLHYSKAKLSRIDWMTGVIDVPRHPAI